MSKYLDLLEETKTNPEQAAAINRLDHSIVKAGPGTGKTRTLVLKATKLLYEVVYPPRGLACVTYAQVMAQELRQKLRELGVLPHQNVFIGTLHGFCLTYILKPFGKLVSDCQLPEVYKIAPERVQVETYTEAWQEVHDQRGTLSEDMSPFYQGIGDLQKLPADFQKFRKSHLDGSASRSTNASMENLVTVYETKLLNQGYVDFEMQVKWAMRLVETEPRVRRSLEARFPWFLIDEYQDVELALHRMVLALTQKTEMKLFAIGDPNQCIYSFSGANPKYFEELCANTPVYGEHITLKKNYRSYKKIIALSRYVAPQPLELEATRHETEGLVELLETKRVADLFLELTETREILPEEVMILHRTWNGCEFIIRKIRERRPELEFYLPNKQFFDPRRPLLDWIGKLMMYCLIGNTTRELRFRELLDPWHRLLQLNHYSVEEASSSPPRVLLYQSLLQARAFSESALGWLSFMRAQLNLDTLLNNYGLQYPDEVEAYSRLVEVLQPGQPLSGSSLGDLQKYFKQTNRTYAGTFHSSKGKECRIVILGGIENFFSNPLPDEVEQDRRLFYVSLTRARDELYFTYGKETQLTRRIQSILEGL